MNTDPTTKQLLSARYFSGEGMKSSPVLLHQQSGHLVFVLDNIEQRVALNTVQREERYGNAPLVFRLPNDATLELDRGSSQATLKQWGLWSESWFEGLLHRPVYWISTSLCALLMASSMYIHGIPVFSGWLAMAMPQSTLNSLFGDALPLLDNFAFEPSRLPEVTQNKHQEQFAELLKGLPELSHARLIFRSSKIGPNAFALPDGTVILTDELEKLLSPNSVSGVLAHEIGHLALRHTTSMVIQNTAVTALFLAFTGDVSIMLTGALTTMVNQHYSREHELDADQFAVDLFIQQGRDLAHLEEIHTVLGKLDGSTSGETSYLSSHPGAEDRLKLIKSSQQ